MKAFDYSPAQYRDTIATTQFWDFLCPGNLSITEKLIHMRAYIEMGGNLCDAISRYADGCDSSQARAIQWTIVEYLSAMMPGGVIDPRTDIMDRIRSLSREGLVSLLCLELRRRVKPTASGHWYVRAARSMRMLSLEEIEQRGENLSNGSAWTTEGKSLWINLS